MAKATKKATKRVNGAPKKTTTRTTKGFEVFDGLGTRSTSENFISIRKNYAITLNSGLLKKHKDLVENNEFVKFLYNKDTKQLAMVFTNEEEHGQTAKVVHSEKTNNAVITVRSLFTGLGLDINKIANRYEADKRNVGIGDALVVSF